ncbi:MAG: FAD-linked oxidase C-terminal domain-containing protein, partial [Gammaproteobacteria bacterium]
LMSSLPGDRLPAFIETTAELRALDASYLWGAAVVICRRGLHGGLLVFYDERTQWDAVQPLVEEAARRLVAAGCVPYKSGKQWAEQVQGFSAYSTVLRRLKQALDPAGILAPGNLGLG